MASKSFMGRVCDRCSSTGSGTCDSGLTCVYLNDWYSQCQNLAPSTVTATTSVVQTTGIPSVSVPPSLDAHVKLRGLKYWGVEADPSSCSPSSKCGAIVKADFGSLTSANSLKWDATYVPTRIIYQEGASTNFPREPSRNNFAWGASDTFVAYANTNGKLIRAGPLVVGMNSIGMHIRVR